MLNITPELVLFTMCGALLAAGSNASQASNVYNVCPNQTDEAGTTEPQPPYWACPTSYWVCPPEAPATFAKEQDPNVRTDAMVSDQPEQPTSPLEDEERYYDYSPMILGD